MKIAIQTSIITVLFCVAYAMTLIVSRPQASLDLLSPDPLGPPQHFAR